MRPKRAPPTAGWHHAMNRAAPGAGWLADPAEAAAFLSRLGEVCGALPVDLHAYCILPRHYHLLARAEPAPLAEALAWLEAASGLESDERARIVPVAFGRHLMIVSRYIHLNPVDAGLVWHPEHWPFSSFRGYLGDLLAPRFLLTEALLGRFGTIGARHRHRAYVYSGMDPGTRDCDGRPRWPALFPEGSLASDMAWRIEPVLVSAPRRSGRLPEQRSETELRLLACRVASSFNVPEAVLRSVRSGGARGSAARGALVHAARAAGGHRLADVAAFMGYSSPAQAAAAAERFGRLRRLDPPRSLCNTADPTDSQEEPHMRHPLLISAFVAGLAVTMAAAQGEPAPTPAPAPAAAPAAAPLAAPAVTLVESIKIVLDDKAKTDGEIRFDFTPEGGQTKAVRVTVAKKMNNKDVAQDLAKELKVALGPDYDVDRYDPDKIKISAKKKNAKFSLTLAAMTANGLSVRLK